MMAQESRLNLDQEVPIQLDETLWLQPGQAQSFDVNFPPSLPPTLEPQQSWITTGYIVPFLGETTPRALPVKMLCTFLGIGRYQGKEVLQVSLRSQFEAQGITGLRSTTVNYDLNTHQPLFAVTRVNDTWVSQGKSLRNDGFHLYFFFYDKPLAIPETAQTLQQQLQSTTPNVVITTTPLGVKLTLEKLAFQPDLAVLLPGEEQRLDALSQVLSTLKGRTIRVVGYTADVGNPEGEFQLSWARALTIVHELEKRGVPAQSLVYEGRGASEPLASNATELGREQNRRVEITILRQ